MILRKVFLGNFDDFTRCYWLMESIKHTGCPRKPEDPSRPLLPKDAMYSGDLYIILKIKDISFT